MIRPKVKAASVDELEASIDRMFAAIERVKPDGVRYASCKLADGVTFVVLLALDDGIDNPLLAVPEFREFQENLREWIVEPPIPDELTVLGTYRLF
ncbi:hypothetical protein [Nonomuraea sp. NPDC002799]